jgi:hypothetical protein
MYRVKRIIALALVFVIAAGAAFSQDKTERRRPREFDRIEAIKMRLDRIEKTYIAQLGFRERREAVNLMNEVVGLLDGVDSAQGPAVTPPPPPPAPTPASDREFSVIVTAVKGGAGPDNKKFIIAKFAVRYFFTTDQLGALLKEFAFDDDRLQAADVVLPKIVDREKAYRLIDAFTFKDGQTKFKQLLDSYQMK